MFHLLLAVIYLAFICLGLPDSLLGSAWPAMYQEFSVPVSFAGGISMIISIGTIISSLHSDRLTRRLGTGKVTAFSVLMTAIALFGFSISHSYLALCLWAVPYGLGAGSVDASLNNYVALHYASRHMSWLHCMWGVGASLGPYVMGYALTGGSGWNGGYRAIAILQFALTAILLISLPLGYFAGTHKDRLGDQAVRTASLVAISMPSFWVGLLLMIVFALKLKWLPAGGWSDTLLGQFRCLILPAITQSLMTSALLLRNTRNSVVDITRMDYVDFARSKGISNGEVRTRHVMRNAMISTVTLLSMRMAAMLGGSVIIETVFSVPGIGKLASDAIFGRDYAVVQFVVLLFAVLVLVINLITDILYSFLDPRVSL